MSRNVYQTPSSAVGQPEQPQLSPVEKPWQRWLIAVWIFLTFGVFGKAIGSVVAGYVGGGEQLITQITVVFVLFEIALIIGVIRLSKPLIYATAASCLLIGGYQAIRVFDMLVFRADVALALGILVLYVVPCFLCVGYFLSPSFLRMVDANKRYADHLRMHKHVAKQLK